MEILKTYRQRIDDLDDKIIDLLVERVGIIREVGVIKYRENIPSRLQDRVDEVRERNAGRAARADIDPDLIRRLYTILIDYSCALEDSIKADLAASSSSSSKKVS